MGKFLFFLGVILGTSLIAATVSPAKTLTQENNKQCVSPPPQYLMLTEEVKSDEGEQAQTIILESGALVNIADASIITANNGKIHKEYQFKKGDKLCVIYENVPMITIYPPKYKATAIVVKNTDDAVKLSYFTDNFMSTDLGEKNNVLLNNTPKASVINLKNGRKVKFQEAGGKNLIVIYDIISKSFPPRIIPKHIFILPYPKMAAKGGIVVKP